IPPDSLPAPGWSFAKVLPRANAPPRQPGRSRRPASLPDARHGDGADPERCAPHSHPRGTRQRGGRTRRRPRRLMPIKADVHRPSHPTHPSLRLKLENFSCEANMDNVLALTRNPRVTVRRDATPDPDGTCVVYWMQRAQRGIDNPALDVAVEAANALRRPA